MFRIEDNKPLGLLLGSRLPSEDANGSSLRRQSGSIWSVRMMTARAHLPGDELSLALLAQGQGAGVDLNRGT